ncbi:hypothetical protein A2U01_0077599, partial [Trifolium medium]|nr:hypothetical protein [Trifolium medium]
RLWQAAPTSMVGSLAFSNNCISFHFANWCHTSNNKPASGTQCDHRVDYWLPLSWKASC